MFRFITPVLFFFPLFVFAHQASLSYLEIQEDANKNISIVYKSPLQDINANKIYINYPHTCKITKHQAEKIENGFIINMQCVAKMKAYLQNTFG